jgi:hypothetical protein
VYCWVRPNPILWFESNPASFEDMRPYYKAQTSDEFSNLALTAHDQLSLS